MMSNPTRLRGPAGFAIAIGVILLGASPVLAQGPGLTCQQGSSWQSSCTAPPLGSINVNMETPQGLAPVEYYPGTGTTWNCTGDGHLPPCGNIVPVGTWGVQSQADTPYDGCGQGTQCWIAVWITWASGTSTEYTNTQPESINSGGVVQWPSITVTVDAQCSTQNYQP
ncbi:MAG: hypothetical protein ACYDAY_01950 [Candidatus Dormibacteria bacterium]